MQSRIISLTLLLCFSALFFFCKKDSASTPESPFFDYLKEALATIDTVEQSMDSWEYGFVFSPLKSGRITQFEIKLPAVGDFSVSLWDVSGPTPVLLRSKAVNSAALHENARSDIQEVSLEAGGRYGITVLSNAFYRVTKAGNAAFDFPRTTGNIRIESFNELINNSSIATFPTDTNDTRVTPCVNVIFIAD